MTSLEANRIMARAQEAHPAWAALDVSQRCAALSRVRRELARNCESIADLIARETAKPLLDALSGDVMVTLEALRYCERHAAEVLRARKLRKPAFFFRGAQFEELFEPHGTVLIFGASNYPLQLAMVPMISALAAGNAVVLKCSDRAPDTAALIARICTAADLPRDLVQILHWGPADSAMLVDARPDMIFFTGSCRHGQAVAERAAKHLIPIVLELGGKDAALVFADCNFERAVEGIVYGAFSNSGRVCVGIKRVYVEAPVYENFLKRIKVRMTSLRVGLECDSDLAPLSSREAGVLRSQIQDALDRGATLHTSKNAGEIGCQPVILTDVPADARLLKEESFGPVLCIAPFSSESQGIALANDSPFALGASIWTRSSPRARRVAAQLCAGICTVNDAIRAVANPHAPFGGNRLSGYGRYRGPEGLRAFSRIKTIMLANDRRSREVNWFPCTARTRRQLAGLLRFRHARTAFTGPLRRLLLSLLFASSFCLSLPSQSKPQTHLSIDVHLDQHAHGEIGYLVFNSPLGFPDSQKRAIRHGFLPIPAGARRLRIDTWLPAGTYAVSVYEDWNGNQKLDRNFMGIPREPVGVSNNPPARTGPPQFNQCSFRLGDSARTITINLAHIS